MECNESYFHKYTTALVLSAHASSRYPETKEISSNTNTYQKVTSNVYGSQVETLVMKGLAGPKNYY